MFSIYPQLIKIIDFELNLPTQTGGIQFLEVFGGTIQLVDKRLICLVLSQNIINQIVWIFKYNYSGEI